MKHRMTLPALLCAAALAVGLLAGCGQTNASSATSDTAGTGASQNTSAISLGDIASDKVKEEDLDASWDEASATKITLDGTSATVDGSGASAEGGTVTITQVGTYVVSGTLSEGQLVINAPTEALVRLVLNGASIHNSNSAAIDCQQADKLLVILADGTENTLSDGDSYVFADETTDEPNATLFSKADLTINGTGALSVNASYNNGIGTKDDLIIVSGAITVDAANHAIRGRDSVTVLDGTLTLTAGNDGIQANNDSGEDKGWIELYGGTYTIVSGHDGIQAETTLTVYDGSYDITAGGGSANAPERAEESFGPGGGMGGRGNFGGQTQQQATETTQATTLAAGTSESAETTDGGTEATDGTETAETETTSDSYKGLKAVTLLTVEGGTFNIDSADDAVHTNGDMLISGGTFNMATGDDGMHADATLTIEGEPVISITECYEGLEGADVIVKGGTIDIVASDDGINAAGGSDGTTTGGGFGPDSFAAGDYLIRIEGGDISITAGADGIDSNGDVEIAGGTTIVNMTNYQTVGGDGAIDRDGNLTITGGTLMTAAGTGITTIGHETTGGSTQALLEVYYTDVQSAGVLVELKDENGNTVASFTPENDFKNVVFSAEGMTEGGAYTLYTDGAETVTATLSSLVTSIQDTGEAYSGGGMGGRGNMGDMGEMPSDMGEPPTDMGDFPGGTPPDQQTS